MDLSSTLNSDTDFYALIRSIDSWTFTFSGTLAVGDVVCIDTNDRTVEKNGVNDMEHFDGDFPQIYSGANELIYTDTGGSRAITIVVSKKDRKV